MPSSSCDASPLQVCVTVNKESYSLIVRKTVDDVIYFRRQTRVERSLFPNNNVKRVKCDVQFTVNRSTLKSMHRSLGLMCETTLKRLFPPNRVKSREIEKAKRKAGKKKTSLGELQLFNESIRNNREQLQAVSSRIQGIPVAQVTAVPFPGLGEAHRPRLIMAAPLHCVWAPWYRQNCHGRRSHQASLEGA